MWKWLLFGALVGAALGLLGSSLDILVWTSMGCPPVLIRRGWEVSHIAMTVFGGLVAGLAYGTILAGFAEQCWRRTAMLVLPLTFLIAAGLYVAGALATIKIMHIAPWFCTHVAVFVVALLVGRLALGSSADRSRNRLRGSSKAHGGTPGES